MAVPEDEPTGDVRTIQEKAKLHLKTWKKKRLIEQLLYGSSHARIGKWAEYYDRELGKG